MPKTRPKKPIAKIVSSRKVYEGPVFWVSSDQVIEPGGIKARRDVVRHTGSVVILAVDDSRPEPHILLERQYRHAVGDYLWELPAGRIDEGEREMAAAKRELLEETGFTAKSWRRILKFYVSPGFLDEYMAVYLARQLRPGVAQPEADEKIEQKLVPLSAAIKMTLSGQIRDAKTLAAVLWFHSQGC
ncbi:MAG TPA: NUDIX hydrolase [Terriglobales bacterium]|nr:NUDIX hydrolase [Terriglobales bacterium]